VEELNDVDQIIVPQHKDWTLRGDVYNAQRIREPQPVEEIVKNQTAEEETSVLKRMDHAALAYPAKFLIKLEETVSENPKQLS
jgi:hypothetical protein